MQRKGFKDVYIAEILEDTGTSYKTETPEKLFKAISGKSKLSTNTDNIYLDDTLDEIEQSFKEGTLEIEGDNLSPAMLEKIYGHKSVKGMTIKNENDTANNIAVGYRSKNSDGTYQFYWWYKVNFAGDEEYDFEQIAEKSKRQPVKLKGTIMPRKLDGNTGVDVNEGYLTQSDTDAQTIIKSWFGKVQEPLTETEA